MNLKRIFFFLFSILFYFISLYSSTCDEEHFRESHLHINLCQELYSYKVLHSLLIKKWTPILNTYIINKIKKGKLKDRKFDITLSYGFIHSFNIEKREDENHIYIDFPSLLDLLKLIDYYEDKDWVKLPTEKMIKKYDSGVDTPVIQKSFLKTRPEPDTSLFDKLLILWQKKDLRIVLEDFKVKYYMGKVQLKSVESEKILPIVIKDRYILTDKESFLVFDSCGKCIKRFKFPHNYYRLFEIKIDVFSEWVNIKFDGKTDKVVSYSYKKNKFFVIKAKQRDCYRNWL